MNPQKGGPGPAVTGPSPVEQPRTPYQGIQGRRDSTPRTPNPSVLGSPPHRWSRHPRPTVLFWDVVAWALLIAGVAGILLTLCVLLTLAWPS